MLHEPGYNACMRICRATPLLLACAAAACATDARTGTASVRQVPSLVDRPEESTEPPPRQPEDAANSGERRIREELAHGPDPEEAALQLAASLAARERYHDALAAVEAALGRRPSDGRLLVARAGLLRDLGMRAEAALVLSRLLGENGASDLHPGILLELAELQWLEGEPAAALGTIGQLRVAHGDSRWVAARAEAILALEREASSGPRPLSLKLRDLLGNLRGAPNPAARLAALRRLLQVGGEISTRAVATGVVDGDPAVRVAALEGAQLDGDALLELAAAMLNDPSCGVRVAAASRLAATADPAAVPPLLGALAVEQEEAAFTAMAGALLRLHPSGPSPDSAGYGTEARRRETAAAWIKHCNR